MAQLVAFMSTRPSSAFMRKDITHLKQGKVCLDPIATAKAQGAGFKNTAKQVEYHSTPGSKPGACDGYLGGKNSPDGRRGWAAFNPAAKPNTTGKGGCKRDWATPAFMRYGTTPPLHLASEWGSGHGRTKK